MNACLETLPTGLLGPTGARGALSGRNSAKEASTTPLITMPCDKRPVGAELLTGSDAEYLRTRIAISKAFQPMVTCAVALRFRYPRLYGGLKVFRVVHAELAPQVQRRSYYSADAQTLDFVHATLRVYERGVQPDVVIITRLTLFSACEKGQ